MQMNAHDIHLPQSFEWIKIAKSIWGLPMSSAKKLALCLDREFPEGTDVIQHAHIKCPNV